MDVKSLKTSSKSAPSLEPLHSSQKNSIRSNNSIQKVKKVLKIIAEDQNNNHSSTGWRGLRYKCLNERRTA
jgi:hypothetical protein